MRCKPGDLAIVVRSVAGNEGALITCLRLATYEEISSVNFTRRHGPIWVTDRALPSRLGRALALAPDDFLSPIRDSDGQDETLTWAPRHETA